MHNTLCCYEVQQHSIAIEDAVVMTMTDGLCACKHGLMDACCCLLHVVSAKLMVDVPCKNPGGKLGQGKESGNNRLP